MPSPRAHRDVSWLYDPLRLPLLSSILSVASAQDLRCITPADAFVGNAEAKFDMTAWMERGICTRSNGDDLVCYQTLLAVLANLNELRKAEYSGAAGVLALLPTVGALLGSPTNEIWMLLTILPFGGVLAMALSFGGAIMPVNVEDYEHAMLKRNVSIGGTVSFRSMDGKTNEASLHQKLDDLEERVSSRIAYSKCLKPEKWALFFGLLGMVVLFIGSQAAMIVLEQGGVLPWWCASRWWMHLWYFLVTLTAATENLAQLPFSQQYKLYVSRVAYEVSLSGGESLITENLQRTQSEPDNVGQKLAQAITMPAAKVIFTESTQYTEPRNSVLVMVSVLGSKPLASLWRLLSKATSIAVFITGTAMFASVTLVSLTMAVMALTLVLSAGVFGRAIAGWMVRRVAQTEPMIHVIVNKTEEAESAISHILKLSAADGADVQVEIDGHVFVNGRRVGSRSRWHVAILGVLADPYDLLKVKNHDETTEAATHLMSQLPT